MYLIIAVYGTFWVNMQNGVNHFHWSPVFQMEDFWFWRYVRIVCRKIQTCCHLSNAFIRISTKSSLPGPFIRVKRIIWLSNASLTIVNTFVLIVLFSVREQCRNIESGEEKCNEWGWTGNTRGWRRRRWASYCNQSQGTYEARESLRFLPSKAYLYLDEWKLW